MHKVPFFALTLVVTSAFAFQGDATWFHPGLGACGVWNDDTNFVAALSPTQYASGSRCSQRIKVWYNDKWTDATVVDMCPGCGPADIDLSPAAFSRLTPPEIGRIKVSWDWA